MTTNDELTTTIGTLIGLAGAANYALAGWQYGGPSKPLRDTLETIGDVTDQALAALDEIVEQPDATVTQLHPEDEPA